MIHDSYCLFVEIEPFEERYPFLQKTFGEGGTHAGEQIQVLPQDLVEDRQHVLDKLKEIENLGGRDSCYERLDRKFFPLSPLPPTFCEI